MANYTGKQIEFEPFKRRRVEVNFDGGDVSSDGGLPLLRKLERRVGLLDAVARVLADPRDPERIEHTHSGRCCASACSDWCKATRI